MAQNTDIPRRIVVKELLSSRYLDGNKPLSWDLRTSGTDTIKTDSGEVLHLNSDGGQAPPKAGWVLMLTAGDSSAGYKWTLYGLPSEAAI